MSSNRKLAAIIFTDIVNYTKTMEADEEFDLELLRKQREIVFPIVEQHKGKVLKEMGDGLLLMFDSAIDAVWCAVNMQSNDELALTCHKMGQHDKAMEHLQRTLYTWENANPDYKPAQEARATLAAWENNDQ